MKSLVSAHCESQNQKMNTLELENKELRARLDEVETNLKSGSLIFHGLEEAPKEFHQTGVIESSQSAFSSASLPQQSSVQLVVAFCKDCLHLNISESDISGAYRIPKKGKEKHRPLVVEFSNRRIRSMVYTSRKILRDASTNNASRIYINENLTKLNAQIFAKARNLVKEKRAVSTWTAGGRVFIRTTTSQDEKPRKLLSLQSLDDLLIPDSLSL